MHCQGQADGKIRLGGAEAQGMGAGEINKRRDMLLAGNTAAGGWEKIKESLCGGFGPHRDSAGEAGLIIAVAHSAAAGGAASPRCFLMKMLWALSKMLLNLAKHKGSRPPTRHFLLSPF